MNDDADDLILTALGLAGNAPYIPEIVNSTRTPVQEAIITILDMIPKNWSNDVVNDCTELFHELIDIEGREYYGWWKLRYILLYLPTSNFTLITYINGIINYGCVNNPPPPPPQPLYTRHFVR
jgi:hypothetical protein